MVSKGFLEENNMYIEFSSGLPYTEGIKLVYQNASIKKILHNYFPPHPVPFVLNLASSNDDIQRRSIDHCIQGLKLAAKSNAPFFSAHSGFCVDPEPNELGKPMKLSKTFDRNNSWEIFKISLNKILIYADLLGIDFLIENNVIIKNNLIDSFNPFFCCDPEEIRRIIVDVDHTRLGLLFDTGHYYVSSNSLNFNLTEDFKTFKQHIKCIHHSSNNGRVDSNMPLEIDYWFKDYIPTFKNTLHVLEVKDIDLNIIMDQLQLLEGFGNIR